MSLTCCKTDNDCAGCDSEFCACWACGEDGTDVIDGHSYTCDTCAAPTPTPPHSHPNICQHLVNNTLSCCHTDADCGDEGGTCWACPQGSSWIDRKYYKGDTCEAKPPGPPTPPGPPAPPAPPAPPPPPAPPTPPAPPAKCDWAHKILSCTADAACSEWATKQCDTSQAVVSYCRL